MNQLIVIMMVILLPGILSTVICDKITRHSKWSYFKFSVYSILLGWLSYIALQVIFIIVPDAISSDPFTVSWNSELLNVWHVLFDINNTNGDGLYKEVFYASIVSVFVAFFASAFVHYKILNKIALRLKISTKYGDENLFSYYLNLGEIHWVYVRDQSRNLTYKGEIVIHSENAGIQELVLSDVDVYRYEDSEHLYSVNNIYLCMKIGEFTIESASDN